MRSFFLFIFLIVFICCAAQLPAANPPLVLSNISEQNGLSDDHVQCVLKDRDGFIWVGTSDGLNLLDGSSIRIFRHSATDSHSVISNNIICLQEDNKGNIWAGTTEGLSCYQKDKQYFFSALPPPGPYGASAVVNTIAIDSITGIWCCTDGGLYHYDPVSKKFSGIRITVTDDQNKNIYLNKLHHLMIDSHHRLWLASTDGVWSYDPQTKNIDIEIDQHNDAAYHGLYLFIFEDHAHNMWFGNWQNGLKRLDRTTGRVSNYVSQPGHPGTVSCINEIQQPDGHYVLWLNGKLLGFDPATSEFFQYPKPLQYSEYPDVSPSFHSADGWMWMKSDKGLYIYNPQQQIFQHHFFDPPLTSQGIVFTEWNHSLLAAAQSTNFLKAYDNNWKPVKDFSAAASSTEAIPDYAAALSFAWENKDRLWVGNTEGITAIDLNTNHKKWFQHKDDDSNSLPRNFITNLFFDAKKQLWVFPWREGIWQMNTETGICKKLLKGFLRMPDGIKGLLIANAVEDMHGNIWMSDLDEGVILYNNKTKEFSKPFAKELGETYHVSRIILRNGFCYANNSFAIIKWNPDDQQLIKIALPPEINKTLYDMIDDKNGNWWLASKNGLIFFDEQLNSFKRYTTADGLVSNDINGTLYCKEDGTIVIGMPGYFTSFDPKRLTESSGTIHTARITAILVNEKPVLWDSTKILHLDYRSTNLVFRWTLPDYTNPLKNQYYFQLEGIDQDWKYTGNKGEIQYANLSAGSYSLLLKAASSNGTLSGNIIRIPFTIHPPFWKTEWFMLLSVLAILLLLIIVVRYISRRNLKEKLLRLEKEQAIEKERNRISRDMHDDLGSGLTKIAIMSEVVKKQMHDPEKAKQQLENISASSRELVDSLQDIIWVLNPKNDSLENLAAYIREYSLKFFEPFGINTRFSYPGSFMPLQLSEETRRNTFLVVKETFNNICKHAWCNTVTISIAQTESRFELKIEDDGKGFDTTHTRVFGNGLLNMKNRIEQVGGIYQILSAPGKGTTTIITLPD